MRIYYLLVFVSLFCFSCSRDNNVYLIIYNSNTPSTPTHLALHDKLMESDLVDSIRFYGSPIPATVLQSSIDSAHCNAMGIPLDQAFAFADSISNEMNKKGGLMDLHYSIYTMSDGSEIPVNAFARFTIAAGFKHQDVLLPEPALFYFKEKQVTYVEVFPKKDKRTVLLALISDVVGPEMNEDITHTNGIAITYEVLTESVKH